MHILIVAQQWEPDEGTPQRRWAWLTAALTTAGHSVDVVTPPPHYPTGHLSSTDPGVQSGMRRTGQNGETIWRTKFREHGKTLVSRAYSQGLNAVFAIRTGRKAILRHRPDVVIATAPPLPAVYSAAILAFGKKIPLVVDLRDVWPDLIEYLQQWNDSSRRGGLVATLKDVVFAVVAKVGSFVLSGILKRSFATITTTPSFSELLRKRGNRRTVSVRNLAVSRGVHLDAPDNDHGTLNVLYAGTIGRAQGLKNALLAVRLVQKSGVDIRVRFVGSGAHRATLERQAKEQKLPVEFIGRIPYDDVVAHYEWADTVLIHLEDWEPLEYAVPSKMYEALEIGRHVSMCANGEAARIIQESGTGDAVPAMDSVALAELWIALANDRSRLDVAGRGRAWLRDRGSIEDNAAKFVRFIEKIHHNASED